MKLTIFSKLTQVIVVGLLSSLMVLPAAIWLTHKFDIIDYPGSVPRKIHTKPTPRAGGIIIVISLIIIFSIFGLWKESNIMAIFLPGLFIFVFAILDDKKGLSASIKLLGQFMAVTLLIILGVRVKFLESPTFFIQLPNQIAFTIDIIITYFWVVGITNAMNLIDSMDGLVVGIGSLISLSLLFVTIFSNQINLTLFCASILGIMIGISLFNNAPAVIFMGDSGAQLIGFILSVICILYHPPQAYQSSSWLTPILFFGFPIFDTSLVALSRIKRGMKFYKGNLDHTYHRLVMMGMTSGRAVKFLQIITIFWCLLGIIAVDQEPLISNLLLLFYMVICVLCYIYLERKYDIYLSEQNQK